MTKREMTEIEKERLTKAVADSKEKKFILETKIEHAQFMIDKGLDMNYKEQKLEKEDAVERLTAELNFEDKLITQFGEILELGEIEDEEEQEDEKEVDENE